MAGIAPKPSGNVINYYQNEGSVTFQKDTGYWVSLMITNDGASDLQIVINNLTITIKSGETLNEDLELWNKIYPIIEEVLGEESIQAIVHIPTEEQILAVLDSIGGEIKKFEVPTNTIIRFARK